jgi:hypothetical protein
MARIAGVDLPRDKRVAIGLTYIFVSAYEHILPSVRFSASHSWPVSSCHGVFFSMNLGAPPV